MKYQIILPAVIIGTALSLLVGCNSNDAGSKNEFNQNRTVLILYKNKKSQNLLNDSTSDHYIHQNVKLYFMKNGKKLTQKESSTGAGGVKKVNIGTAELNTKPRNVLSILTQERMKPKKGTTTTLIELQKGKVDTLKTQYERGNNYFILTKAWYNGQLKWTGNPSGNVIFTVTKAGRNPTNLQQ